MGEIQRGRLNSWKEIANYLGMEVRTVSRWEKEKDLPVHRVPGGRRKAIYAYTDEIDAWLQGADLSNGDRVQSAMPPSKNKTAERLFSRHAFGVAAAVLLLAGIVVLSVVALDYLHSKRTSAAVDHLSVLKDELLAHDKKGNILWTFPFDQPVSATTGTQLSTRSYIADVNGDGIQEILVFVLFDDLGKGVRDRLYCLSAGGSLLWQFEFKETLKFGGREFNPPWLCRALRVYQSAGEARIACALSHDVWWPAVLLVLNGSGQVVGQFGHAGWLTELNVSETPSGSFLLAGGHSNSQKSGVLIVLDANRVSGASPEEPDSEYECQSCSPGRPLRYLAFPPSEMKTLAPSAVWHRVDIIRTKPGRIELSTLESPQHSVASIYEFSSSFELQNANFTDTYSAAHRQLEKENKLDHSLKDCLERLGPRPVRSWNPERGWVAISPASRD